MVSARNLRRRHCDSYGAFSADAQLDLYDQKLSIRPSLMAEQPSRAAKEQQQHARGGGGEEEEELGTRSKEDGWLQLSIGTTAAASSRESGGPTELELFSTRPAATAVIPPGPAAVVPLFPQATAAVVGGSGHWRNVPWGLWSPSAMVAGRSAGPAPVLQYNYRQFSYPTRSFAASAGEGSSRGSGVRVVSPPRRPQAGVWFVLQVAQSQAREPFLPQISRSYLRIRDGRMTVRLLMKYLMNKLGLDSESEVEIRCRGQLLHPLLTLTYVRDNIWCSSEAAMALFVRDSPSSDHVMRLHYSRRT